MQKYYGSGKPVAQGSKQRESTFTGSKATLQGQKNARKANAQGTSNGYMITRPQAEKKAVSMYNAAVRGKAKRPSISQRDDTKLPPIKPYVKPPAPNTAKGQLPTY